MALRRAGRPFSFKADTPEIGGCTARTAAYINTMTDEKEQSPRKDLPPAAQRALAEAEERRKKAAAAELPTELGGRDGPEPVRYGDWEKKGIAVDF